MSAVAHHSHSAHRCVDVRVDAPNTPRPTVPAPASVPDGEGRAGPPGEGPARPGPAARRRSGSTRPLPQPDSRRRSGSQGLRSERRPMPGRRAPGIGSGCVPTTIPRVGWKCASGAMGRGDWKSRRNVEQARRGSPSIIIRQLPQLLQSSIRHDQRKVGVGSTSSSMWSSASSTDQSGRSVNS
jgi:hypothetical protein